MTSVWSRFAKESFKLFFKTKAKEQLRQQSSIPRLNQKKIGLLSKSIHSLSLSSNGNGYRFYESNLLSSTELSEGFKKILSVGFR